MMVADIEEDESNETNLAGEIMDSRKCANTKIQYRRKVDHFRKWISDVYPDCANLDSSMNLEMISTSHLKQFFGHICKKKTIGGENMTPIVHQAFKHVPGYKSAIKDYFSNNNVKLSDETEKMLEIFFKGYNRKIAQMKQDGILSIIEGKQPMSFKGYKFLAKKALNQQVDFKTSISCQLFLILCWNLIARCISIGSLMYNHISWNLDFMVIVSPSHKGDKEGKSAISKREHRRASYMPRSVFGYLHFHKGIGSKGFENQHFLA